MAEERRVSPAAVIAIGLGLGVAAAVGIAALAMAAPPTPPPEGEIYCPYCGAGPFATLDDVNIHITEAHPGQPLIIHIVWE
jgi:hypothetical protein